MPRSARFRQMEKDLRELRGHLLPRKFNPLGQYRDVVYSRTAAYRVLAHAEVEAYLEDRALEVARAALSSFKAAGKVTPSLLCLIGFSGRSHDEPPPSVTPDQPSQANAWQEKLHIKPRVDVAAKAFHSAVEANHGVKEPNILRLLLPLGIDAGDLDQVWLASMNTFGEQRGEAAHTSRSTWKLKQLPDPETEYKSVQAIMARLKDVDALLNRRLGEC